jgi:hypothetical protein
VGKEEKPSTPETAVGWGIGEGRELEVAGGPRWSKVDVLASGLGVGLRASGIDVSQGLRYFTDMNELTRLDLLL